MLRNFILAWTIYWVVVALLPVRSIFPSTLQAFLLQLSFVVLVSSAMFSTLAIFRVGRMPVAGRSDVPHASRLIWLAIAMSGVGLAALMYDKLFVQQIDYSEGVAFAREEWRRAGEEREGQVSSIYSMIGYLFGSAYYVAAVLAVTQTRDLSAKTRLLALLAAFGFLFANSALTGGRSSILLFGAVLVGAFQRQARIDLEVVVRACRASTDRQALDLSWCWLHGLHLLSARRRWRCGFAGICSGVLAISRPRGIGVVPRTRWMEEYWNL